MRQKPRPPAAGRWARIALILAALARFASAAADDGRDDLISVPRPSLESHEAPIQRQLAEEREILDRLVAQSDDGSKELAEAYGWMGRLYFLYDLMEAAEACFLNALVLQPQDFRWHYHLGAIYQVGGQLEQAAEHLEAARAERPNDVPVLIRLGQVRYKQNALDAAWTAFSAAAEGDRESAAAFHGLGQTAYARGDYETAIELGQRALELQPAASSIHHLLGMAWRDSGDRERARTHLAQNRHDPVRFAEPLLDEVTGLVEGSQIHLKAGNAALERGDLAVAIARFRDAAAIAPEDPYIHYNLGVALLRAGDREGAIGSLKRAVEVKPDYRDARYNLAIVLMEEGDAQAAARHLERVVEIDRLDRAARVQWAVALGRSGRRTEGLEVLQEVLEDEPDNATARLNLAVLLAEGGRIEEALDQYRQALALELDASEAARAWLAVGGLLARQGRKAEAMSAFRSAAELAPDDAAVRGQLATALGQLGKFKEAAEEFSRVIDLEPQRIEAHFGRAMALLLAEDYPAANRALEESLEQLPRNLSLTHLLARLLATSPDASIRDGRRALELAITVFGAQQNIDHAETVAMAYAELGSWEQAVEWQTQVLSRLQLQGEAAASSPPAVRLELYRNHRPCRAPWLGG